MTQEELYRIRGEVVDKLVHLDNALCLLISKHYFSAVRNDFIFDVLCEKTVPVAAKKNMLKKIFQRKQLDTAYLKDIDRLLEIRNIFAHAWIVDCGNTPDGTNTQTINTLKLRENEGAEHDELALKQEFDDKHIKVIQYLFRIIGSDPTREGVQTIPDQGAWAKNTHDIGKDEKTRFNDSCPCNNGKIYKNCCGK